MFLSIQTVLESSVDQLYNQIKKTVGYDSNLHNCLQLPDDLQKKVASLRNGSNCKKEKKIIKVQVPTFPPTDIMYSVDKGKGNITLCTYTYICRSSKYKSVPIKSAEISFEYSPICSPFRAQNCFIFIIIHYILSAVRYFGLCIIMQKFQYSIAKLFQESKGISL